VAVVEALNFTKAAAQLRIAQPAWSRQVQAYSRTSFRITPEDRPAPPRHLQALLVQKGLIADPGDVFGKKVYDAVAPKFNRNEFRGRVEGYGFKWL